MRLVDLDVLLKLIEKDKIELNVHKDGKCRAVHMGEYNHFIKRLHEQPVILDEDKLAKILAKYFNVPDDTYAYNLTRVKAAFDVGTMTLDDFEEFDADTVNDIVDYIVKTAIQSEI